MSYRDDVDTLYSRALLLQRELDAARDEIAQLKGRRADTSPGVRELRELPDPEKAHARLVDTSVLEDLPPIPMPDWEHIVAAKLTSPPADLSPRPQRPPPLPTARSLVQRVRQNVAHLREEDLVLVAKIVDELTDGRGLDEHLRDRLRWIAHELATGVR